MNPAGLGGAVTRSTRWSKLTTTLPVVELNVTPVASGPLVNPRANAPALSPTGTDPYVLPLPGSLSTVTAPGSTEALTSYSLNWLPCANGTVTVPLVAVFEIVGG